MLAFVPVATIALPVGWYLRRLGPPMTVDVTGVVTLDGAPLDRAVVWFVPIDPDGEAVRGITDITGQFSHVVSSGACAFAISNGAYPGSYRVTIGIGPEGRRPGGDETIGHRIPDRYAHPATSGLTAEVTADGPNVFTFNLVTE